MFTPQEVQNQTFEKAVFGGYLMAAVDEFLEQLTVDYATLYKENAVLKNKLKVLLDSLEEYRSVDDSMRKALLSAKKMASQTVEEAKEQARKIVAEAEGSAQNRKQAAAAEAEKEERRLYEAQKKMADFLAETRRMLQQQLDAINRLPDVHIASNPMPKEEQKSQVDAAAEEIGNIVALHLKEEVKEEPKVEKAASDDTDPVEDLEATKTRIDLSKLQFGDNYTKPQE